MDAALRHEGGVLDGMLVPLQADGGATCSVAPKAGYPMLAVPVGVNDIGVPLGIRILRTT